jgi:HAD superfamily hydrolase (TIGR01509 family)
LLGSIEASVLQIAGAMSSSPVRGVLLDIDGTLLDSNVAHARAWVDALTEGGVQVELSRVRPLIGKGADKMLPELAGIPAESGAGQAIAKRNKVIFKERYFGECHPFPLVRELVERIRSDGIAVVVASSAPKDELDALLEAAGVRDLIESAATSGDAPRSKPDPDIVRAAARRSDLPPDALLMVGDTPYDVEAARRAGIDALALRSGGWSDVDLSGAIAVYADPADLVARYETSPFVRGR